MQALPRPLTYEERCQTATQSHVADAWIQIYNAALKSRGMLQPTESILIHINVPLDHITLYERWKSCIMDLFLQKANGWHVLEFAVSQSNTDVHSVNWSVTYCTQEAADKLLRSLTKEVRNKIVQAVTSTPSSSKRITQ